MEPGVEDAHLDEPVEPGFGEQVHVRLAEAGAHAGEHVGVQAVLQALHRAAEHLRLATALIADDLVSLHADQRRDVAQPVDALGDLRRNEMSVREDLEVAVRVLGQDVEQLRVHERFAPHDAEEGVAHLARLADQAMHGGSFDLLLLGGHIDPAALAAQIAAVGDGDVQERRVELAPFQSPLVLPDRPDALEPQLEAEVTAAVGQHLLPRVGRTVVRQDYARRAGQRSARVGRPVPRNRVRLQRVSRLRTEAREGHRAADPDLQPVEHPVGISPAVRELQLQLAERIRLHLEPPVRPLARAVVIPVSDPRPAAPSRSPWAP